MAQLLNKATPRHNAPKYLTACIYALEGAGKTTFGANSNLKTLFLDVERGTESLDDPNNPCFGKTNVDVFPVDNTREVELLSWEAKDQLEKGTFPYEVIVLDTGSEYQARKLTEQLRRNHAKDSNRNPYLAAQSDYKESNEFLRRLLIAYRDLPIHFIILAHAKEDKDDNGTLFWRPDLSPTVASTVGRIVSVLGYLSADSEKGIFENRLQVMQTRRVKAKTRIGGLASVIENPSLQNLIDAQKKHTETSLNQESKEKPKEKVSS